MGVLRFLGRTGFVTGSGIPSGGGESEQPGPSGSEILVSQFGGDGTSGVLEALGYSSGTHIPEILRWVPNGGGFDAWGSNYNTGWYTKTDMTGVGTVKVKAGNWTKLELFGIKGTPEHPIWIVPESGSFVYFTQGIRINDCENIVITGLSGSVTTGPTRPPTLAEADEFRFQFGNPSDPDSIDAAIQVYGRCKNIKIFGVKGDTVWYGGQFKTDPTQDTNYNYGGWNMENLVLKYFYFTKVVQDCLYWGNSSNMLKTQDSLNGRDIYIDAGATYIDDDPDYLPMRLQDTEVAYGYIERTGRQALVIGGCYFGNHYFHDIKIRYTGYETSQSQGEAIGCGGVNKGIHIYNIDSKYTFLNAVADFANEAWIHDCVFDEVGFLPFNQRWNVPPSYEGGFLDSSDSTLAGFVSQYSRTDIIVDPSDSSLLKNIDSGGTPSIASTTKIYYPDTDTKVSYIYNNLFGRNSRNLGDGVHIQFQQYGPEDKWTRESVIANNFLLDGVTPISILQYTYNPGSGNQNWPEYSTDPDDIP
jgi:hypothetical protein